MAVLAEVARWAAPATSTDATQREMQVVLASPLFLGEGLHIKSFDCLANALFVDDEEAVSASPPTGKENTVLYCCWNEFSHEDYCNADKSPLPRRVCKEGKNIRRPDCCRYRGKCYNQKLLKIML